MGTALAPARAFVTPIWPGQRPAESSSRFEWHRSETLARADYRCSLCHGLGLRGGRIESTQPCNCTLRAIYRAVMEHYHRKRNETENCSSRCALAQFGEGHTGRRKWAWGYPDHEFLADVEIRAKSVLPFRERRVFELSELQGMDFRGCCRILDIDKGNFFHAVYRMQHLLGRAFRETKPHPLYPIGLYYGEQSSERNRRTIAKPTAPKMMGQFQ